MNFKTTYLLFGLLIAMLGVLGLVLYMGPSEPKGADFVFPKFKESEHKTDDITRVVIQRKKPADADLVFERDADKNWKLTGPRALPTDSAVVNRLVDAITGARFEEKNKPGSLKEAGLDSPSRIVELSGENVDLKLTIGEVLPGEENSLVYVLSSQRGKTPMAVPKHELTSALENVNYFRGKYLLGDDTNDVRDIKLSQGKKGTVELRKEKTTWRMVQPPYGDADVSDLLSAISGLSIHYGSEKDNDFVKDGVTNLAEYHLDPQKNDVLRIEVTRGEGKKATTVAALVGVGKPTGDKKTDEKYYAALDEGKTKDVVKVSASSVKKFTELLDDPGKLRNKSLVQLDNFKTPDAIDVENSYGKLEFRKPESAKPWQLYRDKTAVSVDENEVRQLIDGINKKDVVTSFPDPKRRKELGLEKPGEVVKIWADSLEKPEPKKADKADTKKGEKADTKKEGKPAFKKDAKPVAELRFGNRERDSVAVERVWGNDTTIVMVPATLLDAVRRGPLAYFDRTIPPYNPGSAEENVTKVELVRGGETYEVVREKEGADWKIVKPASLKDRKASDQVVREVLGELNRLTAREVVAEKADAGDLAKSYDLAKPPYKAIVTVTKDKKATTHEFDFGKEAPGGKGVYLKLGGKDTVYLVGPEVLTTLKKELRDTTVFDFDPEKVQAVKITGWKKLLGSPATRTMEKKDGKWVMTDPKGVNLDTTKLTTLLNELAHLHAERVVPSGKELKLAEDALQVEITLPDKKVLELTVGGLEGSSYYATSNQLKGEVFLVAKGPFEEARKAPGYFAK
jgi:hypothetical protein